MKIEKLKEVVGTLFFKDGKLLIDKPRKRVTYQMVGGGVEDNESILEAAIRECKEELGNGIKLNITLFRPLMDFNEIATSDPNLKIHMNIYIYEGDLEGNLTLSEEIENFMWFGINDDYNLLSNSLKNHVVPYCINNSFIF